jgi:hypothetical protein
VKPPQKLHRSRLTGILFFLLSAPSFASGCYPVHRDPDIVVVAPRRVDPDERRERREERHEDREERREERHDR